MGANVDDRCVLPTQSHKSRDQQLFRLPMSKCLAAKSLKCRRVVYREHSRYQRMLYLTHELLHTHATEKGAMLTLLFPN